jgi:hypothetical protein
MKEQVGKSCLGKIFKHAKYTTFFYFNTVIRVAKWFKKCTTHFIQNFWQKNMVREIWEDYSYRKDNSVAKRTFIKWKYSILSRRYFLSPVGWAVICIHKSTDRFAVLCSVGLGHSEREFVITQSQGTHLIIKCRAYEYLGTFFMFYSFRKLTYWTVLFKTGCLATVSSETIWTKEEH